MSKHYTSRLCAVVLALPLSVAHLADRTDRLEGGGGRLPLVVGVVPLLLLELGLLLRRLLLGLDLLVAASHDGGRREDGQRGAAVVGDGEGDGEGDGVEVEAVDARLGLLLSPCSSTTFATLLLFSMFAFRLREKIGVAKREERTPTQTHSLL